MDFNEIKKDLFTLPEDYYLAHCISSDAKMSAGIAVEFRKRFKLKSLQDKANLQPLEIGTCYKYETITQALISMKNRCLEEEITKLAMPQIGCGLDKLQWGKVREILKEVFNDIEE